MTFVMYLCSTCNRHYKSHDDDDDDDDDDVQLDCAITHSIGIY